MTARLRKPEVDRWPARISLERTLIDVVHVERSPVNSLAECARSVRAEDFWREAVEHGVQGLVRDAVDDNPHAWPSLTSMITDFRMGSVAWSLLFRADLVSSIEALNTARIPYALLKGAVLSICSYGALDRRMCSDIDILVAAHDAAKALEVLPTQGHRIDVEPVQQLGAGQVGALLPNGTGVDLHWDLINDRHARRRIGLPSAEVLERRRRVDLDGTFAWTLDRVDTLLHLCAHAALSGGHRLTWYVDIDRTVRADPPDWNEVAQRARLYGLSLIVAVLTRRCADQLGTPVPRAIRSLRGATAMWAIAGHAFSHIPVSASADRGHRGQIYYRGLRSGLVSTSIATGGLCVEAWRFRKAP